MPQVFDIEQAVLLLEIEPPFTKREVQLARRSMAKRWHPDIAPPGRQHEHERHLKAINEAADQLERLAEDSRGGKVTKNAVKVNAAAGMLIAALVETFDNTSYVQSLLITPMFLLAGTFFPLDDLPHWAIVASQFNPLYHCVELVQHACFGFRTVDLGHVGALVVFGIAMWLLAAWRLKARLID